MIFHFTVFFWTAVFYIGLQVIAKNPITPTWGWYFFSIAPLIVISLIASKRLTKRYSDAFLPGLLSLTSPTLLSLIDFPKQRQVFVLLSAAMYYFALLGIYRLRHAPQDQTAQALLNASAMAAMFFFFAGLYGFFLNFSFPLWGLMSLFFIGTMLTSYVTLIGLERKESKRMILYSVLLGLVMSELAWVMALWPFGYLTAGALVLIFFFIMWDVAFDAFRQSLSLRKAVSRLIVFCGFAALLLLSTPWRIIV